ncbi:extracellular solute-binding protein [Erysipelothrix anatis]|uniref:extracellular solute-binding protein n=1 Tax=Erysipelothrix anatis TaxID=2683713 RepID=UPI00135911EB|nr:extracellular solute-binding protein [Erysipelothrix anatis]
MKKIIVSILVTLLVLTGCGSTAEKKDSLVIYSNSASDGRGEWLTEKAKEAGFTVEIVPIPAGDLTNRLIAEKNNAIADMVYGLNTIEFEKLKAQDMLVEYTPAWASDVDTSLGDGKHYYPIVVQPLVFIYNESVVGNDVPKDIVEFADPKYKDQYNVFSLGGGTGKTLYSSILVRYADPSGVLGVSEEGWKVAKAYIQNAHFEIKGEDYIGNVISGERPITMMWGSGVMQHQGERDYKFGVISPEIGVPYVVEQVAILNDSKKELATEFANWFGSAETQAAWSEKFGTIPAHPEAMKNASADVIEFMNSVHAQDIDWEFVTKNIDQWVEKAELEFVQ